MDERKTTSTGYSMSSSAMFRNEKLTLLDEQFEKLQEAYEKSDEEDEDDIANRIPRADFEAILDDFLENYQVFGKRIIPKLQGTPKEKLAMIRRACLVDEKMSQEEANKLLKKLHERILNHVNEETEEEILEIDTTSKRDAWDCESILSKLH
jgi:protein LTV1